MDSNDYPVSFSKAELVKTAGFYKTADPHVVFAAREETRGLRKISSTDHNLIMGGRGWTTSFISGRSIGVCLSDREALGAHSLSTRGTSL